MKEPSPSEVHYWAQKTCVEHVKKLWPPKTWHVLLGFSINFSHFHHQLITKFIQLLQNMDGSSTQRARFEHLLGAKKPDPCPR
jgi:hypothetical protein